MRKKEHSGSAAVIGAQLVILFILTVSLCVQSRKAAAENTYAVMEESGEGSRAGEPEKAGEAGDSQKKKYIHWVEFNVPADVMEKAFRLDMGTVQEEVHFNWVELLAYLGAKYGGDFERFRQADLDAVVELDIKIYEEEPLELVEDLYATDREIDVVREENQFDKILTNTTGKCKITDRMKYDPTDRILQICHHDGQIKIDQVEMKGDGLEISGVLEVIFLYMTSDDKEPLRSGSDVIPFQYFIEVPEIDQESVWQLTSEVDQLSSVMMGNDTIEVRAALNLELLVLQPVRCPVITGIQEKPLDLEALKALPGITGYIMKKGDRLWDVAKRFHTTVDHVMEMNELDQEEVKEGQRLLLVKELR